MARSAIARHIVSRVEKAQRLDPMLTIKQASKELGISPSSFYKLRAGTRTGQGSIKRRVIDPPHRADGMPQTVSNAFNVRFRSGERVASRNVTVRNYRTKADALVLRHDPKTRRALQKQLAAEERATGAHYWRRAEIRTLTVESADRMVYGEKPVYWIMGQR